MDDHSTAKLWLPDHGSVGHSPPVQRLRQIQGLVNRALLRSVRTSRDHYPWSWNGKITEHTVSTPPCAHRTAQTTHNQGNYKSRMTHRQYSLFWSIEPVFQRACSHAFTNTIYTYWHIIYTQLHNTNYILNKRDKSEIGTYRIANKITIIKQKPFAMI